MYTRHKGSKEKGVSSHNLPSLYYHTFTLGMGGACVSVSMTLISFSFLFFRETVQNPRLTEKTGSSIQVHGQGHNYFKAI